MCVRCSGNRYKLLFLAMVMTSIAFIAARASASPGSTTRVSTDSAGNQANANSAFTAISADGRYVAFYSGASNLVPGDTNGVDDVFVHDRETGATERVSVDSEGNQGNGHAHYHVAISGDGRYVAFASYSSNLVLDDTNGTDDVFVHDRQSGQTTRVSVDSAGNQANNESFDPSISADGRYVAFYSWASNLVPGDTNNDWDVFVHDNQTGETTLVSVNTLGVAATGNYPNISADGRYVAFYSWASNLVPGDTNNAHDVFVRDLQTQQTERVSVDSAGNQANGSSTRVAISSDGRYVAFTSDASNLVLGDTNGWPDVFLHDRVTGKTARVSVDSMGNQANGRSDSDNEPTISSDGRYIGFWSLASNLVAADTNTVGDVFVHDSETGTTQRVSVDTNGNEGNAASCYPSLNADGRYMAFESNASNLVTGDTNARGDVFVRDLSPTAVGGIAEYPQLEPLATSPSQGSSQPLTFTLAAFAAGGALLLAAGGWYARRRWLR